MSSVVFEELICLIVPIIGKKNTNFRLPISVNERLALTLRFLATGDSYHSLMYQFKISVPSIPLIIPEVCSALINSLNSSIKVNLIKFYKKIVYN